MADALVHPETAAPARTRALLVALAALAAGSSQAEACEAADISRSTLARVLASEDGQRRLQEETARLASKARQMGQQRLQAAVGVAVDALVEIARGERGQCPACSGEGTAPDDKPCRPCGGSGLGAGPDSHARVKAASAILDRSGLHARQGLEVSADPVQGWSAERLLAALPAAKAALLASQPAALPSGDGQASSRPLEEPPPDGEGGSG